MNTLPQSALSLDYVLHYRLQSSNSSLNVAVRGTLVNVLVNARDVAIRSICFLTITALRRLYGARTPVCGSFSRNSWGQIHEKVLLTTCKNKNAPLCMEPTRQRHARRGLTRLQVRCTLWVGRDNPIVSVLGWRCAFRPEL